MVDLSFYWEILLPPVGNGGRLRAGFLEKEFNISALKAYINSKSLNRHGAIVLSSLKSIFFLKMFRSNQKKDQK